MTCPRCQSETYILRGGMTDRRTRRCLACGHTFETVEIYAVHQESVQFTRFLLDKLTERDNGVSMPVL